MAETGPPEMAAGQRAHPARTASVRAGRRLMRRGSDAQEGGATAETPPVPGESARV